jgi:fructan beta-fructosidase
MYRRGLWLVLLFVLSACGHDIEQLTVETDSVVHGESQSVYIEPYRPQFHFSPPTQWMNDPNGMVFYAGEYHLFYQYYPEDTVWGPMHWGHAVSKDLVHWQHLPIALYPDDLGYIYSGSAVVDWQNTSGFGVDGQPPMVAVFTHHQPGWGWFLKRPHETQGIAYSNDRGRTWVKYQGNPVLPNTQNLKNFRDPKVFWHEDTRRWVMALSATDHVQFWGSSDLKSWQHLSDFGRGVGAHGGTWECPDLIEMTVDGSEATRWVLIQSLNPGGPQGGSGTQYFVGDFDGRTFSLDPAFEEVLQKEGAVWLDAGRDNYAGVTWSDIPEQDGRHLFIGWMSNWQYAQKVPTHPWRSAMTLPRELVLTRSKAYGYRVFSRPVAELESLRGASRIFAPATIYAGTDMVLRSGEPLMQSEWQLEFEIPKSGAFNVGIEFSNPQGEQYRFGYNGVDGQLYSDRTIAGDHSFSRDFPKVHRAPRLSVDRRLQLQLFLDSASVEAFVDEGGNVLTDIVFPSSPFTQAVVYVEGADVKLNSGSSWGLRRIWD